MPLRIAFMGTPDFAVPALEAVIRAGHNVACIYTQPPRPKGRGQQVQKSPVHVTSEKHGIEVRTPKGLKKTEAQEEFAALELDVAIVAAYGLILPKAVLDAPKHGCLNIHASLLPRWRGASPIQHAIWYGDQESGVSIMQMDEGLDTGPVIDKKAIPITDRMTAPELHDALATLGGEMIVQALNELCANGNLPSTPQPEEGMTYAPLLHKDHGRIDWSKTAVEIDRQVRALNPRPGTWTGINGNRLKILDVELCEKKSGQEAGTILDRQGYVVCGHDSVLKLIRVQPQGKKPMDAGAAINGSYLIAGERF